MSSELRYWASLSHVAAERYASRLGPNALSYLNYITPLLVETALGLFISGPIVELTVQNMSLLFQVIPW